MSQHLDSTRGLDAAPEPCHILGWDTDFWGKPIARVDAPRLTPEAISDIDAWCGANGVRCVFFLADVADSASTLAAERGGFFLTDVRVTFKGDLHGRRAQPRLGLRTARPEDHAALEELARISHGTTRFFHDPYFDDDRCGELYARWMRDSLERGAAEVLVAEADGKPIGYATCELDEDGELGRIGLIAVEPSAQRRGIGRALCEGAFDCFTRLGAQRVEIVTQGRNLSAQRVFQRAGAHVDAIELWFHKWYQPLHVTS